jgi:hypothetical protein
MLKTVFLATSFSISLGRLYSQDFKDRIILGEGYAKKQVQHALKDNVPLSFLDTLIKTKEEAITIAEPVLFKIYGRKHIIRQRSYEIYLIDGYWFISGTLPKGSIGGTFEIILKSEKGQVIKISHYQ